MRVTLTEDEAWRAAQVGARRQVSAVYKGWHDRNGAKPADGWTFNIIGALGECAAAKALGIDWPMSVDVEKHLPDLPPDWQVRTRINHNHDLIVRNDDDDEQRFLLVTGMMPLFLVHGWVYAREGKRIEWWDDKGERGKPCYWVPQSALHRLPWKT